jgi:hypothetical protein
MTVKEVILNTSSGELDVELNDNSSFRVNIGEVIVATKDSYGNPVYMTGGEEVLLGGAGGSGITSEQAVDAVAAALTTGTHSGVTVAYDDTGNKINLTVTASGSGVQVNSDWNASAGVAQILNKPTIPTQYTDEMAQDAVAAALAAGTHTNITVTYDDANNKINLAATAGGSGGSYVKRKVNLTANTGTATCLLVGFGTQAQLDAVTVVVDSSGTLVTIGNVTGGLVIQSATINYTDGFTGSATTTFEIKWPAPFGATTLDQISYPDLLIWNAASMRQNQTFIEVSIATGNISLKKTGLTGGTGLIMKAVCI